MNTDIKPIRFFCQKVLPLVYDDSLSYYEVLCKMNAKLNEVINAINGFEANIEGIVDEKLKPVYAYIDSENAKQDKNLNDAVNDINAKIIALQNDIIQKINLLYSYIDSQDEAIINLLNQKITELKDYIDNIVIGKITMFDPTRGYLNTLQKTITNVYNALRYRAITCDEFKASGITCDKFKSLNLTALKFAVRSREYIFKPFGKYIFDAISGQYVAFYRAFYNFVASTRENGITCSEFVGDNVTCDLFNERVTSCLQFATDGKNLFK